LKTDNPDAVGEIRYVIPRDEDPEDSDDAGDDSPEASQPGDRLGRPQVRAVVDQLFSLRGQPKYTGEGGTICWRDMALLLPRRTVVLTELERELRRRDMPFVVTKGIGFWQRQEVRDVSSLASCLADSGDELALFGVLRGPLGHLNDTEILFLSQL